jgi:hypothetical protein
VHFYMQNNFFDHQFSFYKLFVQKGIQHDLNNVHATRTYSKARKSIVDMFVKTIEHATQFNFINFLSLSTFASARHPCCQPTSVA